MVLLNELQQNVNQSQVVSTATCTFNRRYWAANRGFWAANREFQVAYRWFWVANTRAAQISHLSKAVEEGSRPSISTELSHVRKIRRCCGAHQSQFPHKLKHSKKQSEQLANSEHNLQMM